MRSAKFSATVASRVEVSRRDPEARIDVYDPIAERERANLSAKRRLSDDMEEVFGRACGRGELETAAELLRILVAKIRRDTTRFPHDRRLINELLTRLTAYVEGCKKGLGHG